MAITVEAVYEGGVLKLAQPLPVNDGDKIRITAESALTWAEQTAGILPWTGNPEILRRIAEEDELQSTT